MAGWAGSTRTAVERLLIATSMHSYRPRVPRDYRAPRSAAGPSMLWPDAPPSLPV
jgi:hypothetical protein